MSSQTASESTIADASQPRPVDLVSPQLTLRAVLTGALLGGLLSICNIYTSLKIGWSTNMSITGILVAYGLWHAVSRVSAGRVAPMGMLENNINQAACSAAAAVASAGLVAPIPAWTILTGQTMPWHWLALWVFSVCIVGITVATGLRRQMIVVDKLPFVGGIACAETLREIYNRGSEAIYRLAMMGSAAVLASIVKILQLVKNPWVMPYDKLPFKIRGYEATKLGFDLDPNLILFAVGGLIGPRAGLSLLLGALIAFGVLAPWVAEQGIVPIAKARSDWLVWPGVTLMVVASMTSFAFSWKSIVRTFVGSRAQPDKCSTCGYDLTGNISGRCPECGADCADASLAVHDDVNPEEVPRNWFITGVLFATLLAVIVQVAYFQIAPWMALLGVLLSFVLAVVATRVNGETNVTPIGAMGKVTQLTFGFLDPASPTANLMAANVTGGAASQCADLMQDFKAGWLLGGSPRKQFISQMCGALAGSLAGSAFYLLLVPNPAKDLLTQQWPAPAVVTWKAVAEIFMKGGFQSLPLYTKEACAIAAIVGVLMPILDRTLPRRARVWLPSATSIGLAFVVPASNAITMCAGALLALGLQRTFPAWSSRFLVTICAGLIAGESLTGAGDAVTQLIRSRLSAAGP
ncbi:MAG: OPT family oligopeptide transporter [Phycisphaerae bacterium]